MPRSSSSAAPAVTPETPRPHDQNNFESDYYEIFRLTPRADRDNLERVYRTLADRFHPDNRGTGDAKAFQRVKKAFETLTNDTERAKYNAARQQVIASRRFCLRGQEFFDGVRGSQNRRLAVLCILYRQKLATHESPGLATVDLEQLTGCTSEELTAALWYLCEKNWASLGELSDYSITAEGFDVVEREALDRSEFRAIATLPWYDSSAAQSSPSGIGLAANMLGDAFIADHYDILRIDEKADADTIERVYRAFVNRFHPDNPNTGDMKAFVRVSEAYDVLSNPAKRAEYNALRQSPEFAERYRLRRREFFDGIEGEQLRRLAVLCHLYRQAANKLPGLFGRDLEQLTGCTREELGSALWYLREKKWARLGGFSEYTITAAGFDVVENQVMEPSVTPEPPAKIAVAPEPPAPPAVENYHIEEPAPAAHSSEFAEQFARLAKQVEPQAWEVVNPPVDPAPAPAPQTPVMETPVIVTQPVAYSDPAPEVIHAPVINDNTCWNTADEKRVAAPLGTGKRVILSMGGKGGVGKTSVMTGLAEWFDANQIDVTLLDLDIENKMKGSLTHYFGQRVPKINIHTPAGLDAFVDHLGDGSPVILADMGAGAGHVTHEWFEKMYPDVSAVGIAFTAIGVVTHDPASVESVLNWAASLQDRVSYVIVENHLTEHANFTYWEENVHAQEFRQRYSPAIIRQDYRLPDLENAIRKYGVTLGQVAGRTTNAAELQKASLVMRAQSYRRRIFAQFDKVKDLLLP
ncbi:MAG TPA: DnaJ domain-containing protein [Bryobacteraceae bacterium]|nr:DnaJ domain-containing protein [Bryobacteraceae bacterium]